MTALELSDDSDIEVHPNIDKVRSSHPVHMV